MKVKDGKEYQKVLDDQVQLYTSNKFIPSSFFVSSQSELITSFFPHRLLTHPLVSPINQGSLGGLCPLMIVSSSTFLFPSFLSLPSKT